jgi:hypothetical protein
MLKSDEIPSIAPKVPNERKKSDKVPRPLAGLAPKHYAHLLRLHSILTKGDLNEDESIDSFLRHQVDLMAFHPFSVETIKFSLCRMRMWVELGRTINGYKTECRIMRSRHSQSIPK